MLLIFTINIFQQFFNKKNETFFLSSKFPINQTVQQDVIHLLIGRTATLFIENTLFMRYESMRADDCKTAGTKKFIRNNNSPGPRKDWPPTRPL